METGPRSNLIKWWHARCQHWSCVCVCVHYFHSGNGNTYPLSPREIFTPASITHRHCLSETTFSLSSLLSLLNIFRGQAKHFKVKQSHAEVKPLLCGQRQDVMKRGRPAAVRPMLGLAPAIKQTNQLIISAPWLYFLLFSRPNGLPVTPVASFSPFFLPLMLRFWYIPRDKLEAGCNYVRSEFCLGRTAVNVCVHVCVSLPVCRYKSVFCIEIGDFGEVCSFNYAALKQNMSGLFHRD